MSGDPPHQDSCRCRPPGSASSRRCWREAPAPPALTSARYTRDFNEVKALGSATSTERTPAQTDTARFFSGSAPVQYNAALRDQVRVRDLDIVAAARMFAAVDMSVADGIISVWHAKYVYGYWRPITAINLADTDGNPATVADPTWTPLLVTPPYPDHPSGYNVVNAAVSQGTTPPPGTWEDGSPPGPSTTTSSPSTGTEERDRPAAGSGPPTGWLSDRPPLHQRRRHSVAVPPVRLRLHLRMQVHQVQP